MATSSSKKPAKKPSRPIKKIIKIILLIVLIPIAFYAVLELLAVTTTKFQKPRFVNEMIQMQNKLAIPALLEPRMENGEKVFDLSPQAGKSTFLPGKQTDSLGFNGSYLGPTIRAHTGDKIRMNVTNKLSDATTVHWHGMHLPAGMDGGPHQVLEPGENWQPTWTIGNQASTLWYHPHLMGKTGEQVYRGLAGFFYIDDDNADSLSLPKTYGVDDIPLAVQDRKFDANGQFVYTAMTMDILGHTGMLGDAILVNGTYAPYLEVPAKQVRLRVLNASNARRYDFAFDNGRKFQQIASDGGLLSSPVTRTDMILAPGERAEIVVDLTGTTKPLTLLSNAVHEEVTLLRFIRGITGAERDENQKFKILELRPHTTDLPSTPVPTKLNTIEPIDAATAVKTRQIILDSPTSINGKSMDPKVVNEIVHSSDTEIWNVRNESGTYHPFHIHGVQFQILGWNNDATQSKEYEKGWKDTVLIPNGAAARLIMKFPNYSDPHVPYMYHCHILEHEDMGMMGQFVVVSRDTKDADISITPDASVTSHGAAHGH